MFQGSASGIPSGTPATADAVLVSGQVDPYFGYSAAGAGAGDGRLVVARQSRGGTGTPVHAWGSSYTAGFQVSAVATHPAGRGRVKLQVKSCPPAVGFGHASCATTTSPSWLDVTASPGGVVVTHSVSGIPDGALRRWRTRVLHAPFHVTQAGITPPPSPAHGPWRRLFGQGLEADLRVGLDTDFDGVRNTLDLDDDGDGLTDTDEISIHGTDPLDADSDDDGLADGPEVALGTDPLDEDTDDDLVCDGGAQVGSCTAVGPDNCPFVLNFAQTNGDGHSAGDACQCGDVTGEGVITAVDRQRAREYVVGRTLGGVFDPDRCDVTADAACDVEDPAMLDRIAEGASAALLDACAAYGAP